MQLDNTLNEKVEKTIAKTLLTANLFDGFWDRWNAHGVKKEDISFIRESFLTKDLWIKWWKERAEKKMQEAIYFKNKQLIKEAELSYRLSALYYQLNHWLMPGICKEKSNWLNISLDAVREADELSNSITNYVQLPIGSHIYFGRVRIPAYPKGTMIIINPLDSTKEELFTYEMDFLEKGFITISFDGPGQGQTYTMHGVMGTKKCWEQFVDEVIEYAAFHFGNQKIYLFGTSSGAAWSIYGSCNLKVSRVVAVSPAMRANDIKMPDYFIERTQFVLEEDIVPSFYELPLKKPVLLVHGKKDVMLKDEDIYKLYTHLPNGKSYLEFENEGHCCNYKLPEIRQKAIEWIDGKWGNNI